MIQVSLVPSPFGENALGTSTLSICLHKHLIGRTHNHGKIPREGYKWYFGQD